MAQRRTLRRYRETAVGANTAISATDQARTASSGCCIGHADTADDGTLPPNRFRHMAATALSGFQLAKSRSQAGIPWVGTNALDTNDSGRNRTNPMAWALSG